MLTPTRDAGRAASRGKTTARNAAMRICSGKQSSCLVDQRALTQGRTRRRRPKSTRSCLPPTKRRSMGTSITRGAGCDAAAQVTRRDVEDVRTARLAGAFPRRTQALFRERTPKRSVEPHHIPKCGGADGDFLQEMRKAVCVVAAC